jgi:CubicO group peptidase (beta-lactamase class C family)
VTSLQDRVRAAAEELVASGAERGVQVAVYRQGEQVAEVAAGIADPASGRPVEPGTVFGNYSIGKGATATVVHVLAERGLLGYDTPVAELWPEFAANGKAGVSVRHVLTHAAGVPGIPAGTTPGDLADRERMCAAIAAAEPWWEPGTAVGYHSWSFGFVLGEIVRRVTGRSISEVLAEEVTGPLGVDGELWFGVPAGERHRLATLEDDPDAGGGPPPSHPRLAEVQPPGVLPTAALGNDPVFIGAEVPSAAQTSARAIARMYAALLGPVDGVRLIPPDRLRAVTAIAAEGPDQVFGNPSVWGLGYAIGLPGSDPRATASWFGMPGAGGSLAYADTATGTALAVTKNRLGDLATATRITQIVTRPG